MTRVLLTGAAGFIGSHVAERDYTYIDDIVSIPRFVRWFEETYGRPA